MSLLSPFSSPLGSVSDKHSLPPPLLEEKENLEPDDGRQTRKVTFVSPTKPVSAAELVALDSQLLPTSNEPAAAAPTRKQPKQSDPWSELRDLDDRERWCERSTVVTKADHETWMTYAAEVVEELIAQLPCYDQEEFRCAGEMFSENGIGDFDELDFLDNVGTGQSRDKALARQSLYVRFDPLVSAASPRKPPVPAPVIEEESAADGSNLLQLDTPRPASSAVSRIRNAGPLPMSPFALCSAPFSPHPIDFPVASLPRPASSTPTGTMKFDDDAVARPPMGGPLNLLENATPHLDRAASRCDRQRVDVAVTSSEPVELQYTESDLQARIKSAIGDAVEKAKEQMSNEGAIYDIELDRLAGESKVLNARSEECDRMLQEMRQAVDKSKMTVAESADQSDAEMAEVIMERNKVAAINSQLRKDVDSLSNNFVDLFSRFEKMRTTVTAMQSSFAEAQKEENATRTLVEEAAVKCRLLKESAAEKIQSANTRMDQLLKDQTSEAAVLKANIKKATLRVEGLQRSISQKDDDNSKLNAICEEMMAQMQQPVC